MVKLIGTMLALAALAALGIWLLWGNTALTAHEISVSSPRLPGAFDGLRIAQVSDLHNAQFGSDNAGLLSLLEERAPDLILLTGDLIDSRRTDVDTALAFAARAARIAPTYYVPGNHEARLTSDFPRLEQGLGEAGVTVLRNEAVELERAGETLRLIGIDDPDFGTWTGGEAGLAALLADLGAGEGFTILLSHRPELFETYAAAGVDLAFTGHAHGGQVRLPFVGGLFAPHQGLFPRCDAGLYAAGEARMIVSRGLGNSIIPLRVNNRPELVVAELSRESGRDRPEKIWPEG